MADFLQAYKHTARWEGGYANHSKDKGGETMRGVARRFHPNWPGWKIVDQIKKDGGGRDAINANGELLRLAAQFFQKTYWSPGWFAKIEDQSVAAIMFDWAILTRIAYAWEFAAKLGAGSPDAINKLSARERQQFFEDFKDLREAHHRKRVADEPDQDVFLDGWLNRNKYYTYPGKQTDQSKGKGKGSWLLPIGLIAGTAGAIYYLSRNNH